MLGHVHSQCAVLPLGLTCGLPQLLPWAPLAGSGSPPSSCGMDCSRHRAESCLSALILRILLSSTTCQTFWTKGLLVRYLCCDLSLQKHHISFLDGNRKEAQAPLQALTSRDCASAEKSLLLGSSSGAHSLSILQQELGYARMGLHGAAWPAALLGAAPLLNWRGGGRRSAACAAAARRLHNVVCRPTVASPALQPHADQVRSVQPGAKAQQPIRELSTPTYDGKSRGEVY